MLSGKRHYKIRLAQIDAPEKAQPYGQQAKQALIEQVYRRSVRVEIEVEDKYGRMVGTVWQNGNNINQEQVRRGMAWVYTQYSHDPALIQLEHEARRARRGLWAQTNPTPPWAWRHSHSRTGDDHWGWQQWLKFWRNPSRKPAPIVSRLPQERQCDNKQSCREMTSCDEARFYLEQCGLKRLDANGDGIPCETLCRK